MSQYVAPYKHVKSENFESLAFLFERSCGMTVPECVEPGSTAYDRWPADRLDLGSQGTLMAAWGGLETVADVVDALNELPVGDALVEVQTALVRHSAPLPPSVSDAQAAALDRAFGSSGFGFDALGMLRRTDRSMRGDSGAEVGAGEPRVADAPVPLPLRAGLAQMGCVTVREASYVPDADILALHGVGETALCQLRDHEAACEAALEASLSVATEGARKAWDVVVGEYQWPLCAEAYDACMPLAAVEAAGTGRTADEYARAIENLVRDMSLRTAMAELLEDEVAEELQGFRDSAYPRIVPVPRGEGWDYVAERLAEQPLLKFDGEAHQLEVRYPRLADWLQTCGLDEGKLALVSEILGDTFDWDECGRLGLKRNKVVEFVSRLFQSSPALVEDRYRYFLETYWPTCEEFMDITGEPVETYEYLRRTGAWHGDECKPLPLAIDDPDVPEEVRTSLPAYLAGRYVDLGGVFTKRSREAIVRRLLELHADGALMSMGELRERYDQVVGDAGDPDGSLAFPSDEAFRTYVSRLDGVMVLPKAAERRYGGSVRLFDPGEYDCRLISLTLALHPYDAGKYSAEELFADEHFAGLMEHAGVHNGYELHHVLTKHCEPIPGVKCGRSPMLEFEKGPEAGPDAIG